MPERYSPMDDLFIPASHDAMRYVGFRAENRPGRWCSVRTIHRDLCVRIRIEPEDRRARAPERIEAEAVHDTRPLTAGERYEVLRGLCHAGLLPAEEVSEPERHALRLTLTRAAGAARSE